MAQTFNLLVHNLRFWLAETGCNFARDGARSVWSLALIAALLGILGASGLFVTNFRRALDEQTARLELVVLLDKRVSPARRREIFHAAHIPQVKKLELTLASAALKRYSANLKLPADELRATNPLRDELRVELHYPADFWKVRAYLTSISGVTGTRNPGAGVHVPAQMQVARTLMLALLALFAFVGPVLIWATRLTIRRTIRARRPEIRVMTLVGATPMFIRAPFLMHGAALGALGAVLASAILGALSGKGLGFAAITPRELLECAAALLAIGAILGVVGAALALRGVGYERFEKSGAAIRNNSTKEAPLPREAETPG